ncbi:hypothetical protein GDO81_017518 [Engystomops pustulosus]|uniref:Uncharacterized protein n=1 Tax=Engystomops pustulosus TaxID=76066 RepID=A0AAV7AIW0_ENGPU|nr:hypothetical protein GDO81_017518 [Engystomops pustulosus]
MHHLGPGEGKHSPSDTFSVFKCGGFSEYVGFSFGHAPRFPSRACRRRCATIRSRAPQSRGNSGEIGANRKYSGNTSGKRESGP